MRGMVASLQPGDYSQQDNEKRVFDLVDETGSYVSCCAVGHNARAVSLQDGNDVVLYFCIGQPSTDSHAASIFVFKDGLIVQAGVVQPERVKKRQIDLE